MLVLVVVIHVTWPDLTWVGGRRYDGSDGGDGDVNGDEGDDEREEDEVWLGNVDLTRSIQQHLKTLDCWCNMGNSYYQWELQ